MIPQGDFTPFLPKSVGLIPVKFILVNEPIIGTVSQYQHILYMIPSWRDDVPHCKEECTSESKALQCDLCGIWAHAECEGIQWRISLEIFRGDVSSFQ